MSVGISVEVSNSIGKKSTEKFKQLIFKPSSHEEFTIINRIECLMATKSRTERETENSCLENQTRGTVALQCFL